MVQEAEERYVVTVATYGRRSTVRSDVFLNHHLYREPDGPIGMDYFVWVARSPQRTVVVDTGFSRAGGESRGRDVLVEARDLYDRLGVFAGHFAKLGRSLDSAVGSFNQAV